MRPFLAVLGKELISFFRSWGLLVVVLYSFTLDIYIAAKGITLDARNISVGYTDASSGVLAAKILSCFHAPQFQEPKHYASQEALMQALVDKEIMVGLVFESDFAKRYYSGEGAQIGVLLDATAAAQSYMALSYIQNILLGFESDDFLVAIQTHKLFNPNASYSDFMGLSELLSIITMLSVILTSAIFVREKEQGTWDIMLLMPVAPWVMILAKIISQVIIVTAGTVLSLGLVLFGIFDLPMNGSFWLFMLLALLFAFTSAGLGLFIAAVSKSMLQVAQLSVLVMMPLIFLSGAWTPVYAMHPALYALSFISPLRYFIEGSESLFFRGTPFVDLLPQFAGVIILGAAVFGIGFRKIGKLF